MQGDCRAGERAPDDEIIAGYVDSDSDNYQKMVEKIREKLNFTSLEFFRLDDMISSTVLILKTAALLLERERIN